MHRRRRDDPVSDDPGADHRHFRHELPEPGALHGVRHEGATRLSAADFVYAGAEIRVHLPAGAWQRGAGDAALAHP